MTVDPTRRLADTLANFPEDLRRIRLACVEPPACHQLAEVLAVVGIGCNGDPEDPDLALDLIADALGFVLDLKAAAGGPAVTASELSLLLDPAAVVDAVLDRKGVRS